MFQSMWSKATTTLSGYVQKDGGEDNKDSNPSNQANTLNTSKKDKEIEGKFIKEMEEKYLSTIKKLKGDLELVKSKKTQELNDEIDRNKAIVDENERLKQDLNMLKGKVQILSAKAEKAKSEESSAEIIEKLKKENKELLLQREENDKTIASLNKKISEITLSKLQEKEGEFKTSFLGGLESLQVALDKFDALMIKSKSDEKKINIDFELSCEVKERFEKVLKDVNERLVEKVKEEFVNSFARFDSSTGSIERNGSYAMKTEDSKQEVKRIESVKANDKEQVVEAKEVAEEVKEPPVDIKDNAEVNNPTIKTEAKKTKKRKKNKKKDGKGTEVAEITAAEEGTIEEKPEAMITESTEGVQEAITDRSKVSEAQVDQTTSKDNTNEATFKHSSIDYTSILNSIESLIKSEFKTEELTLSIVNSLQANFSKQVEAIRNEQILQQNEKTGIEGVIVEKFVTEINSLKTTLDTYSREAEDVKTNNSKLLSDLEESRAKLTEKNEKLEQVNQEVEILNNNLTVYFKKLELKDEELEKITSELTEQKRATQTAKEENERIKKVRDGELETIAKLKDDQAKLQESLEEERKKYKEATDKTTHSEEKVKKLEKSIEELNTKITSEQMKVNTYKQSLKQIFLIFLDEDIFIDLIEKTFKSSETDPDKFFEDIYKMSKYVGPKFSLSTYKTILNADVLKKLGNYNLETDLSVVFNAKPAKNPEDFLDSVEKITGKFVFQKVVEELIAYIEKLAKSVQTHIKQKEDLKVTIKNLKDQIDESKKNDTEKSETLHKQLAKMQQDFKDFSKTEKLLKETVESLEGNIREAKTETDKLNQRIKNLNTTIEEISKDKENLKEANAKLKHTCETYELENSELVGKLKQKSSEVTGESDKLKALTKERDELKKKLEDKEKLNEKLLEKMEIIASNEKEISSMKVSYQNLEELMENMRMKEERTAEINKGIVAELEKKIQEKVKEINLEKELNQLLKEENKEIAELKERIFFLLKENETILEQKEKLKKHAESIVNRVKNELKETDYLIDKRIISDFLFKYFDKSKNDKLKLTLLDYFSNLMGYNNEERRIIGLPPSNFASVTVGNDKVKEAAKNANDKLKDISDDLYNFILNG